MEIMIAAILCLPIAIYDPILAIACIGFLLVGDVVFKHAFGGE